MDGARPHVADEPVSWGDALAAASVHGLGPPPSDRWDWDWRHPPTWLRVALAILLVAACTVGGIGAYRHFFGYAPFDQGGSAHQSASVQVGRTIWLSPGVLVNATDEVANQLTIQSVSPRVIDNSAAATISVERCDGRGIAVPGSSTLDAAAICRHVTPYSAGRVPIGKRVLAGQPVALRLLIAVTPHRPGSVVIDGVTIGVYQDWRHGAQHIGTHWTVTSLP